MSTPLHEQLRSIWEQSDLTLDEVVEMSKVECSADSLSRKLGGKQALRATELAAVADVFGYDVKLTRRSKAA